MDKFVLLTCAAKMLLFNYTLDALLVTDHLELHLMSCHVMWCDVITVCACYDRMTRTTCVDFEVSADTNKCNLGN